MALNKDQVMPSVLVLTDSLLLRQLAPAAAAAAAGDWPLRLLGIRSQPERCVELLVKEITLGRWMHCADEQTMQ